MNTLFINRKKSKGQLKSIAINTENVLFNEELEVGC